MSMKKKLPNIIPIFPLSGVIYFPKINLPLNIFEPKYLIKNLHKKIYATLLFFFRNKNFKGSLEQRKTRYLNDLIEIENQRKNIRNFYQSENEKLEKYLNLDLKKFKY